MKYTLRNVPEEVDRALRARAERLGKSLNEVVILALSESTGHTVESRPRRDLADIIGAVPADPGLNDALNDQREPEGE
jgi:plasmid stability protein